MQLVVPPFFDESFTDIKYFLTPVLAGVEPATKFSRNSGLTGSQFSEGNCRERKG